VDAVDGGGAAAWRRRTTGALGNWKGWNLDQLCGADIWGRRWGLWGLGDWPGGGAAGVGLQHEGDYTDAVRAPQDAEKPVNATFQDMNTAAGGSGLISLHVRCWRKTRGLFDTPKFFG